MELLRPLVSDPSFTVLYLAVEAATSVKGASTRSKQILKLESDNLLLWDAHARLERLKGRIEPARTVYTTALAAAIQRDARASEAEISLWQALLEMEIEVADERVAAVLMLFALRDPARTGELIADRADVAQHGHAEGPRFTQIDRLKAKKVGFDVTTLI
jgi:hypothetical protein